MYILPLVPPHALCVCVCLKSMFAFFCMFAQTFMSLCLPKVNLCTENSSVGMCSCLLVITDYFAPQAFSYRRLLPITAVTFHSAARVVAFKDVEVECEACHFNLRPVSQVSYIINCHGCMNWLTSETSLLHRTVIWC